MHVVSGDVYICDYYSVVCISAGTDGYHWKPPVGTYEGTYHLIGGSSMEGISPPDQLRGIYSSAKDDESAMSNGEYLMTLTHQQVGVACGWDK